MCAGRVLAVSCAGKNTAWHASSGAGSLVLMSMDKCYVLLVSSFCFSISGLPKLFPSQPLSVLIPTSGIEVEKIGMQTEHLEVTIHKEICFKTNVCIGIVLPFIGD